MNKYFKNFILCGELDFYCLLCDEALFYEHKLEKHIRWETHRKILKEQECIPKYKKDHIYKIRDQFYCELCNYCTFCLETLSSHIKSDFHKAMVQNPNIVMKSPCVCKKDVGFVLIHDKVISEEQWHCIVGDRCLLCGQEYCDLYKHVRTKKHVKLIIKSKLIFEDPERFYRRISEDVVYCFICSVLMKNADLENHWAKEKHMISLNKTLKLSASALEMFKKDPYKKIDDLMKEAQSIFYNYNRETCEATCNQCNKVLKIHFRKLVEHSNMHFLETDIQESIEGSVHSSSAEEEEDAIAILDHGKRRSNLAKYGKKHSIKLNQGGSRGYCSVCNTYLSAHRKVFREHVNGTFHKGNLEIRKLREPEDHKIPEYKIKFLSEHINTLFYSETVRCVWINENCCIEGPSLLLFSDLDKSFGNVTKCFACNSLFPQDNDREHFETEAHKKNFLRCRVVAVKSCEFIREIHAEVFHCGICNKVYPFWENMEKHLNGFGHCQKKNHIKLKLNFSNKFEKRRVLTKTSYMAEILYNQIMHLKIFK